jgi:hypothetical protein
MQCNEPVTRVVFRGRVRRLFLCASCVYEGKGKVCPYAVDVLGQEKVDGTFYGPARTCGQETEVTVE